ncbi:unnamed protein product [Parajaminaea phylloscopi]
MSPFVDPLSGPDERWPATNGGHTHSGPATESTKASSPFSDTEAATSSTTRLHESVNGNPGLSNESWADPLSSASAWASSNDVAPSTPLHRPYDDMRTESPLQTPRASQFKTLGNGRASRAELFQDVDQVLFRDDKDSRLGSSSPTLPVRQPGSPGHRGTVSISKADADDEEDEDNFAYPGYSSAPQHSVASPRKENSNQESETRSDSEEGDEEESSFHYPTQESDAEDELGRDTHPTTTPSDSQANGKAAEQSNELSAPAAVDFPRLHQLCIAGQLEPLQHFFRQATAPAPEGAGVSGFFLANEPHPTSGLTPLHHAAKEGRLDIVKWLVEDVGALVEMEDREGETALHKAALAGRLPVLTYLLNHGAEADAKDADGWTAMHNACSRGYLDLVKCLVETAQAALESKGGRGGWTPLMNAAANGHLPVVRYLTSKHHVDPFQRNLAGETAFDVAAANFEIFICDVLGKYEAERWVALRIISASDGPANHRAQSHVPYNPLSLHSTVPVTIHQNERLDTRLSTLAVHGGKPRWSGTGAGRPSKPDRRAPGTMPPGPMSLSKMREVPMRREDVRLPVRRLPYRLQLPSRGEQLAQAKKQQTLQHTNGHASQGNEELGSTPTPDSVLEQRRASSQSSQSQDRSQGSDLEEPSHFWICEWQIDRTHPQVDAQDGWQYARSFDSADDQWYAQVPAPLARLIEGKGLGASLTRAITATSLPAADFGSSAANRENDAVPTGWVRRRRWIRVMRRRLDIEFGDDLEAAELSSLSVSAGALHSNLTTAILTDAEQDARRECEALGTTADYVARAKALAGQNAQGSVTPADLLEEDVQVIRKRIARLELGINELRGSAFDDEDSDRRSDAEGLLKEFTVQLGQLRQAAGMQDGGEEDSEDEEDEEFIYPNSFKDTQSVITRIERANDTVRPALGQRHSSIASVFNAEGAPAATTNHRSADLARASEFRVPTNETPQTMAISARGSSLQEATLLPTWERDEDVRDCRGCGRKFTFFTRKHHCRRCGRIYCAECSSHRDHLSAEELIIDPGVPEMFITETTGGPSRICGACHAERQLTPALRTPRGADQMLRDVAQGRGLPFGAIAGTHEGRQPGTGQSSVSDVSSRASELNECPVCNTTLAQLGPQADQEEHVRQCLENGGGGSVQGDRYLVYKLPADSPIVSKECVICLEELLAGHAIARLPCLCYFHRNCIDSWLARGRSCPTHAR